MVGGVLVAWLPIGTVALNAVVIPALGAVIAAATAAPVHRDG